MSAAQIRFFTLSRREVNRFMKIKKQTIGAPLLETFLYISVFGAALGSRIDKLHGIDYVVFVIPGLIMMAWAINAFSNNSSSILQQKFQGAIQDQLSSPASPLELLLAFSLGGFMRGLVVAVLTFTAASFLVDLPVDHILVLIPALFLVGFFFAQLGVLIGVRAEQFDDVAIAQTFVLQPLIFLGGVFYSAVAAARAVRDPDPLQPGLLHDRPRPLRLPRLRRGQRGAVAALPHDCDGRPVRGESAVVLEGVQAAGLGQLLLRGGDGASGAVVGLRGVAFSPLRLAQAGLRFFGSFSCRARALLGVLCAFLRPLGRLGGAGMLTLRLSLLRPRRSELCLRRLAPLGNLARRGGWSFLDRVGAAEQAHRPLLADKPSGRELGRCLLVQGRGMQRVADSLVERSAASWQLHPQPQPHRA